MNIERKNIGERMKQKKYEFWLDSWARKVIERENKLKRGIKVFRCESGLGASGIPHIGSFGDVVRANGIALALKDAGIKSELIPYSDDRDGLRKVPLGLPDWLEKYIGVPVTDIPDPFDKCHDSYGHHMSSLLLDAVDKTGIDYNHHSATEDYKKGVLNQEIETILLNADLAGKILKDMLGQEKFEKSLAYFPVCEQCGKIYTTRSYELLQKEHKVLYVCSQEFTGKNSNTGQKILIKGCGHKGEASYFNGTGKLSWKVEFAARWHALKIMFEPFGKDILDSVRVNDEIDRQIFKWEPPLHFMYEMFLDKSGKKISKSVGNVLSPQVWYRYANVESLILLMLRRPEGTREVNVVDIPTYMDDVQELEKVFRGIREVENKRDEFNEKRLFEYIHLLKKPKMSDIFIPYRVMIEIAKILPENNQLEFAVNKLKEFGYLKDRIINQAFLKNYLDFTKKWVEDFEKPEIAQTSISNQEKEALRELIEIIRHENDEEKLQTKIFETAKKHDIKPIRLFTLIYQIILKQNKGPRLGSYIIQRGKGEIIELLNGAIN